MYTSDQNTKDAKSTASSNTDSTTAELKCFLCHAITFSYAELENHLITAHHVIKSCINRAISMSAQCQNGLCQPSDQNNTNRNPCPEYEAISRSDAVSSNTNNTNIPYINGNGSVNFPLVNPFSIAPFLSIAAAANNSINKNNRPDNFINHLFAYAAMEFNNSNNNSSVPNNLFNSISPEDINAIYNYLFTHGFSLLKNEYFNTNNSNWNLSDYEIIKDLLCEIVNDISGTDYNSEDASAEKEDLTPKHFRTIILPSQQEYLLRAFRVNSNPPRESIEKMSFDVGLSRRVIQVWFQNTRARERRSANSIKSNWNEDDVRTSPNGSNHSTHIKQEDTSFIFPKTYDEHNGSNGSNKRHDFFIDGNNSSNNDYKARTPSLHNHQTTRRFRTQMSPLQVRIMKAIFIDYKTPTMPECEALGKEIGLQKRVVQVWFQNARAKEKKNPDHIRTELCKLVNGVGSEFFRKTSIQGSDQSKCLLCRIQYDGFHCIQRDHLFSSGHIQNLRECFVVNCRQIDEVKRDIDVSNNVHEQRNSSPLNNDCSTTLDENNNCLIENIKQHQQLENTDLNCSSQLEKPTVYDPEVHGTPLRLLRIPLLGLSHIAKMIHDDASIAQYTDDSSSTSEINRMGFYVHSVSIDVGFVCKACQLAWPRYNVCFQHILDKHQHPATIADSFILKIEQILHRCDECSQTYPTLADIVHHSRVSPNCKHQMAKKRRSESDNDSR